MKSQISVRLSEDVIQAITKQAEAEGRNRNQQIEWLLRLAIGTKSTIEKSRDLMKESTFESAAFPCDAPAGSSELAAQLSAARTMRKEPEFPVHSAIIGQPYKKCSHGGNEYTCERVACKIKTGRA